MILKNANVFPATGEGALENTSVAIEDGEITAIGGDRGEHAEAIDLEGGWVLPGFIDAHVHLSLDAVIDPYDHADRPAAETAGVAIANARAQLAAGFTTVRDCGAPAGVTIAVRDVLEHRELMGPRILASGSPLTVTGGHAQFVADRTVDGPDAFLEAARTELAAGADFLKLIATGGVLSEGSEPGNLAVTEAELAAVAEEARRAGVQLAVHAHGDGGIRAALEAGADTVEHNTYASDRTLDVFEDTDSGYVSTIISTVVQTTKAAVDEGIRPYVTEKATAALEAQLETFRAAQERDIPILLGTDAGTPRNPHGTGAREFEQFVENGFDETDALLAGTRVPAAVLGLDGQIGTVEVGKRADLVVLPGDPREDITVTRDPSLVVRDGIVIEPGVDGW